MKRKLYWGLGVLIILLIGVSAVLVIRHEMAVHKQLKANLDAANKLLEAQNKPSEVPAEKGHVHDDGTFHVGEHGDPIVEQDDPTGEQNEPLKPPPSRDFEPVQIQIPEGITDPDVLAAWERLDYIANNIWDWGGVPSQETEELIAQLMPPPDGFSGPSGHSDAEETINLLGSLDRNDPRSAEVMVTYYCENIIGGLGPRNAIIDIGPPAVPLLIPYLFEDGNAEAVAALGGIVVKHRKELGGIVDHIIIPKLEEYAAIEDPPGKMYYPRKWAREALELLK